MNVSKMKKYINLALNNSSEGEASTAARMFFSKLNSMGVSFNPAVFGLKRSEAAKLATLAGKIFRGLNDGTEAPKAETVKPKAEQPKSMRTKEGFDDYKADGYRNKGACCYDYFSRVDMDNGYARRAVIDLLCQRYGFGKATVQSYASNFRKYR